MVRAPPLVKAANWLSRLAYDWESPVWRHWLAELSSRFCLVRYDERGCGLSDWDIGRFSFDDWVDDLEAVVDAAGPDRFPLPGISQGGPVAIAYAVRHPERVTHLVLLGSYAQGWRKSACTSDELALADARIEIVRFEQSRLLAALIPQSRLVPLDSSNHLLPERDPAWRHFLAEIDRFLPSPQ